MGCASSRNNAAGNMGGILPPEPTEVRRYACYSIMIREGKSDENFSFLSPPVFHTHNIL